MGLPRTRRHSGREDRIRSRRHQRCSQSRRVAVPRGKYIIEAGRHLLVLPLPRSVSCAVSHGLSPATDELLGCGRGDLGPRRKKARVLDTGIGPPGYHRQYYSDRDWRAYSDILARIVRQSPPGPVLDLGAGCGYLVEAASRWGIKCVGLEGSAEALEMAKSRAPDLDVRFHRLSSAIPFPGESYGTVVLNQVIEHLEPAVAKHVVREALRVLRPGGMLIVLAPSRANRREAEADPTHVNMMSPTQLRDMLVDCGFD